MTRGRYFNTFGGNPVASAVGLEVLRVIEDERLQQNAADVGAYARAELRDRLMPKHASIGDVRGMGLLFGVELVKDRQTREPDAEAAQHVMHHARTHGSVLVSTDGPHRNVVKIKPPMCLRREDADALVDAIDHALEEFAPER